MELWGPELRKKKENFINLSVLDNLCFSLLGVGGFPPAEGFQFRENLSQRPSGQNSKLICVLGQLPGKGFQNRDFAGSKAAARQQQGSSKAAAKEQEGKKARKEARKEQEKRDFCYPKGCGAPGFVLCQCNT